VIDYELLPYHRFGLGKYELLGRFMNWMITKRHPMICQELQAIIDEAFGRSGTPDKVKRRPTRVTPKSLMA